eukprot:1170901-Prorocentrum_minimum.AAC.1
MKRGRRKRGRRKRGRRKRGRGVGGEEEKVERGGSEGERGLASPGTGYAAYEARGGEGRSAG